VIEQKINEFFGDAESTGFGTGWWSGILSAFFGFLSFGAVLCLHFPQLLTSPELRSHYPMFAIRVLIQCLIVGAFIFGIISSALRKKKTLAFTGLVLAIAATALGGSSVQINETLRDGPAIGLDWFLLDMFLMALIYVPLETLWPQYPEQGTFRNEWTLDVVDFGCGGLWMLWTSCPLICQFRFYLFWFYCPLLKPRNIWVFRLCNISSLECLGFCNFSWRLWLRMLRNTSFIWLCTKCLFYGAFMPFTILRRRWIGSLAHARTSSMTPSSADSSSFLSCLDFRNRSFSRI